MKCSVTLGDMTVSPNDIDQLPENPVATVDAYLRATYSGSAKWIVQDEPGEGFAKKVWYKADETNRPTGDPCASITISED